MIPIPPTIGTTPDDWHSTPPEQPGEYEFCCGEMDYEIEKTTVVDRDGELWCQIGGEYRPVQMWHDGLTSPAWRVYDDMNEPLGPACVLGDTTCESCQ